MNFPGEVNEQLREETQKLERSWSQYPEDMLRDYMVAGIHDPRINPQSIRSRHFLLEDLFGGRFHAICDEEFRFGAVMRWLMDTAQKLPGGEDWQAIEFALSRGRDNVEGIPLPIFIQKTFSLLPRTADGITIPNYLRDAVQLAQRTEDSSSALLPVMNTFADIWKRSLENERPTRISVLEPACGSANDYRAYERFGLARHIEYLGFDLCEKNIANARKMFPEAKFEAGNVFAIGHEDKSFDYCVVHDLLEHLSLAGLDQAVAELARVTRRGIFIGFFQMHEGPGHIVRGVDEYHWNTLSLPLVRGLFERFGRQSQAIHVNTWLNYWLGCGNSVYYDTAYDFLCLPSEGAGGAAGTDRKSPGA